MELPYKYLYGIYTWGGFYNPWNVEIHGYRPSQEPKFFDTEVERQDYIDALEGGVYDCREKGHTDPVLCKKLWEGYDAEKLPTIHRIVEYKGKRYYSEDKWSWPTDYSTLVYYKENKWYPGFNDRTVEENTNEDVNYDEVVIIQEWITGSFILNEEN